MSIHNPKRTLIGGLPYKCECGWGPSHAQSEEQGWRNLRDHLSTEWSEEQLATIKAERIRASTEGQNWDMP